MKKLILSIGLLVSCLVASGQNHVSQSFLSGSIRSLQVSNTLAISNLTVLAGMTNVLGIMWTNSAGARLIVTNAGNAVNLLTGNGVDLWADRNGNAFNAPFANLGIITNASPSPMSIFVRLATGGSGANAAVNFNFVPSYDGVTVSTNLAESFSFGVTAAGVVPVTLATNCPVWRWPGAKKLILLSIVNADTDATSQVIVDRCSLNGFRP